MVDVSGQFVLERRQLTYKLPRRKMERTTIFWFLDILREYTGPCQ